MARNAELFNRLADHFEKHPDTWDQESWGHSNECGTHACIAGWTAILTYGEAAFIPDPFNDDAMVMRMRYHAPNGRGETILEHAGRLLGLDDDNAARLFHSSWRPNRPLPDALRALADGVPLDEVSK